MTYIIIFLTVAVSALCFYIPGLFDRLAMSPYQVWRRRQWYRMITHGFVHGDWTHLLVNMLVFWSFGTFVEQTFALQQQAGTVWSGTGAFLLLYSGGIAVPALYDLLRRRGDPYYVSVGASGAVSAVVFTSIFFAPMQNVYFFGAIPIPGIIFGVLYILYESYLARRRQDNINHWAHITGAAYGFAFPLFMEPSLIRTFLNGF